MVKWSDQSVTLKDFSSKSPVPNLIRITKGQYRTIGVAKNVYRELYLHSIKNSKRVMAQSVKVKKEGKKAVISNQKYSLPVTYQGWFEVMSADGKSIRAINSIQELSRLFPHKCLVRDNIKAYITRESGELLLDRMRVIHNGEQLTLVGEMNIPLGTGKNVTSRRLLRCLDDAGESVYFNMEQKGLFSPMAGHNNISGVHNIRGLLEKFRLPIMVRLVHGIIPTKLEKSFNGVFRLTSLYSDETAYIIPLRKDTKMLPISTREPLKVAVAENFEEIKELEECQNHQQRCDLMISNYLNSIHLLYSAPDPDAISAAKDEMKRLKIGPGADQESTLPVATALKPVEEDILFEEVEDIYRYVREGGEPPAPRTRPQEKKLAHSSIASSKKSGSNGKTSLMKIFTPEKDSSSAKSESTNVKKIPEANQHVAETKLILSTGIDAQSKEKDLDQTYWEEPIYEPLDKIRQKKKDDAESLAITDAQSRAILDHPVDNLRQVLKLQTQAVESGVSPDDKALTVKTDSQEEIFPLDTDEEEEVEEEDTPPPVPPKQFYFGEHENPLNERDTNPLGGEFKIPPAPNESSQPVNSTSAQSLTDLSPVQTAKHPNGTASAIVVAKDTAIMSATASVVAKQPDLSSQNNLYRGIDSNHNLSHTRVSVARPKSYNAAVRNLSTGSFSELPPYVAVAHVGDHSSSGSSGSPPLGNRDVIRSNSGKIKNIYR